MAEAILDGARGVRPGLTVLFDERCPLCRRLKAWLAGQVTLVPIEFLAAGSTEARRRFPDLDHDRTTTILTVVTAGGEVYEAERAWLVCGWALPGWQPTVDLLDGGLRLRAVRLAARMVDGYRHRLMARQDGDACEVCQVAAPAPRR